MEDNRSKRQAFTLGMFAGELLITQGVIQPDFQIENIGMRGNIPTLLDYADVIRVKLPDALTKDVVRIIKESLFSLVDDFEGDFACQSYTRAGFLLRTGMLGHMVYEDARDNKYSSFMFVEREMKSADHSLARITKWTDVKSTIGEWMNISIDVFKLGNINDATDRKENLSYVMNKYYLKNTLHILSLIKENITEREKECIYADIATTALQFGMPYMAYGFASKCKASVKDEQLIALCSMILNQTYEYVSDYLRIVDKHLNRDPIELMWILEDLDITVPGSI